MKIGVVAPLSNKTADPATMARACEERGFESFFVGEHTAVPVGRESKRPSASGLELPDFYYELPAPFVSLSFAAAVTTRIKIGTAICLVAEHHPLELAKTVATLDRYSNGRFIFGIGSGWNAEEAALFGIDFSRRWGVTRDYVRAMIKLWAEDDASHEGEFVSFPLVRQYPKPVQKPHPPIHIGAFVDAALKDVATYGSGWMPGTGRGLMTTKVLAERIAFIKRECEKQGRDFREIEISCLVYEDAEPCQILDDYAAAGAHRLVLFCPGKEGTAPDYGIDGMQRRLDEIAEGYLKGR
ncbi:MAG: LLM class F420-dependent oxidoreductase [Rhodospirillaceae bacterium]|nr:MAG: LLM class F420-dependent oxidoreductase [Rhodospirillaceae bacterium]